MRLDKFIEFNPRVQIKKGDVVPFVPMEQVTPFTRSLGSVESKPYTSGMKFCDGDTIVARITPSLENGKTARYVASVDQKNLQAFGSTEFIVCRAIPGISDSLFIYYLMISREVRDVAIASMTGSSGRQRVQLDQLKSYEGEFPSLDEQRKIVHILGALDDKIESNQRQILSLHDLAVAKFSSLDFDGFRQLSDVAQITMGSSPKGTTLNEQGEGEVFYQGTRDFGFRYPVKRVWTTSPTRMAQAGDTLVAVRAPVGSLNRAPEQLCVGRGLAAVSSLWRSLIFYSLLHADEEFRPYNSEGTVFGAINKQAMNSLKIRWPKNPDLADRELAVLDDAIWCYSKQNDLLKSLRDVLLPELLSSRITPEQMEVGL